MSLHQALRNALDREEFQLHCQPQVSTSSGAVIGVEALLRWQRPDHGEAFPGPFLPVLEETGLIVPVGTWVLRHACMAYRELRNAGMPLPNIAVNVSAKQLQQVDFFDCVMSVISEAGIDASALELEITESTFRNRVDRGHSLVR